MRTVKLLPLLWFVFTISCSKSSLFELYTLFSPKVKMAQKRIDESMGKSAGLSFRLVSDSSRHSLNEFRGKTVFLNFWATWCAPCIEEIPELNKMATRHGDKIIVIGISDENTEKIRAFLKKHQTGYLNGFTGKSDPLNEPYRHMRRGRPLSFLIDPDGVIKKAYLFPVTLDEIEEDLEECF